MIKYNLNTINDWNFGDDNIIKVYRNGAVVFYKFDSESQQFKVCYAVVDDISQYSDREFEDVYDKATEKWYKLNNLNEYEEYGVYASGRTSCEGSSRLPQGYTEVEYIESNGTQYINTNAYITNTANFEVGYTISGKSHQWGYVHQNVADGAWVAVEESKAYFGRWNSSYWVDISNQITTGNNTIVYKSNSGITVNETFNAKTLSLTSTDNITTIPLHIFGWWDFYKGGVEMQQKTQRYKSFYLKVNGVLIRDLVPAKRDSDDKYGMYDIVNDVFYTSPNGNNFIGGEPITPTECVTTYNGKLTIDDGYEYEWNGSSWVNLGEVSGSSKTSDFTIGDIDTPITSDASLITDGMYGIILPVSLSSQTTNATALIGSSNSNTLSNLSSHTMSSVISENDVIDYAVWKFHETTTANTFYVENVATKKYFGYSNVSSSNSLPLVDESSKVPTLFSAFTYNNVTALGICKGNTPNQYYAINNLYGTNNRYNWFNLLSQAGDLNNSYMIYKVKGGDAEYPKYYSEKSEPLDDLTFNTLEDAISYAYNNCVYDGMHATIDGNRYYFDSTDENGWVKILEYYKFEDVTPGGASGWTISGSDTYNPDSSYYDDFDIETTSINNLTKIAKVTIYGYDHFTYYLRSYHPYTASYGYVMATNVDEVSTPPSTMQYYSSSAITNTYNFNKSQKSAVNLSNYRRVTYNSLDKTVEHTFYVYFYGRTYSSYIGNATILIPKEQTNENWEQVTFSASSNVANYQKSLYIDGNNSSSGGTQYWHYRWMVGLPSGSHSSSTNYSNFSYCPNVSSSAFTSVAGAERQVNFTYDSAPMKSLNFEITDENGNAITSQYNVYYYLYMYNTCGGSRSSSINKTNTMSSSYSFPVGGYFSFGNNSNRQYIYGYQEPTLGTTYYVDDYTTSFKLKYTKLNTEAVTITYTTYDPSDVEIPAFKTDITWPYSGGTTSSTTLTSYTVPYTYPYKVSQTSDKFSADSQSYTANQTARTINFVLYPDNREFATVADMEAYQYAWEGMKATVGDTSYEYRNGQWVENSGTIWLDPSATNALFSIGHYWGENYKMVITTYLSGSYSGDYGSFWQGNGHTPIELSFYSNGFYYDFHNPTSTTAPDVYTGDYSWRIMKNSTLSSYENGQILNIILSNGAVRVELESTGAAIVTGSTSVTAQNWYSGLYLVNIGLNNADAKCHLSHIQIYNGNNELVNDLKFIKNSGVVGAQEISLYDSITKTTYNNTNSNTPVYHIET